MPIDGRFRVAVRQRDGYALYPAVNLFRKIYSASAFGVYEIHRDEIA